MKPPYCQLLLRSAWGRTGFIEIIEVRLSTTDIDARTPLDLSQQFHHYLLKLHYNLQLLRELPNLGEKNKEQPLCRPYSIKARALLHAHLSRMKLPQDTLEADRRYIVSRCPDLIVEMVNCVNQLIALAYARRSKFSIFSIFY